MNLTPTRNWEVVGLTPDNYVIEAVNGVAKNSHCRPSEVWGDELLTRKEKAILRRGLTPAGNDRSAPK